MPASRWNADIFNLINWITDGEREFEEMILAANLDEIFDESLNDDEISKNKKTKKIKKLPEILPILPLRGLVVFPQTAVPLTVGQPRSIRLVDDIVKSDRLIGLIASKDPKVDEPGPELLYDFGTIAIIHRLFRAPDGTIRLLIQGTSRFKVSEYVSQEPYLKAMIKEAPEKVEKGLKIEALARNARDQFGKIAELVTSIPTEIVVSVSSIKNPLQTVYNIANLQRMDVMEAQNILEMDSTTDKLQKLVNILTRESEVLSLGKKIQDDAKEEIEKVQRDYFLREQLKAIQKELGESDQQAVEVKEFKEKIEKAGMSDEAKKQSLQELDRLSRIPTASAEYGVIRSYLDWLVTLPWSITTKDDLDIKHAQLVLDRDHYGLEDVKERILEYLAVRKMRIERKEILAKSDYDDRIRQEREGVILCFIGPPGVGKTSLGKSIAQALGRKFIRTSLGGLRDEAEIRGHRRTYIGALPGRIMQSLRRVESKNPVFMLDEIDKLASDFRGDPASALLEVLDPEQNSEFRDNYIEVAFDLSQVMFITTANQISTIPVPLRDRMEIINISGYTENEKVQIAHNYLVPRQLQENGLKQGEVTLNDDAIQLIIREYTRESGVRNLERKIGGILRKVVTRKLKNRRLIKKITSKHVKSMLGKAIYKPGEEIMRRTSIPGVATGLAWTPTGGDVLFIEATQMPGKKNFKITGSVGDVMEESAQAALSYVRANADDLGIDPDFFETTDLHLHIPTGATPKDGPSAGITMITALTSLLSERPVQCDVGMTGEITLKGQILPVGGIKEKMLAAHRAGLKKVFLPKGNKQDLEKLPDEVLQEIEFIPVENVKQVLGKALKQCEK